MRLATGSPPPYACSSLAQHPIVSQHRSLEKVAILSTQGAQQHRAEAHICTLRLRLHRSTYNSAMAINTGKPILPDWSSAAARRAFYTDQVEQRRL